MQGCKYFEVQMYLFNHIGNKSNRAEIFQPLNQIKTPGLPLKSTLKYVCRYVNYWTQTFWSFCTRLRKSLIFHSPLFYQNSVNVCVVSLFLKKKKRNTTTGTGETMTVRHFESSDHDLATTSLWTGQKLSFRSILIGQKHNFWNLWK